MRKLRLGLVALAAATAALAGGSALAATPSYAASATTAVSHPSSTERWVYAGKYYTFEDCQMAGNEEIEGGADRYKCDPEIEPDGKIAYYNLYVLYL